MRLEQLRAGEWRIADDHVGSRPCDGFAVGVNERVGGDEVGVEVVEGQGAFGDVELVNRQLAGNHHRNFGDLDGQRVDVESVEVLHAEEADLTLLRFGAAGKFVDAFDEASFKALEFAVGDVKEVAGATRGIEHAEIMESFAEFAEAFQSLGGFDLFAPRVNDRRPDDLHDVDGAGVVRAERAAFLGFE